MAKQEINVGATANDRSGDSLRAAFQKVNENFTELYASSGFTGTTNKLVNGAYEITLDSTGILTFPDDLNIANSVISRRYEETTTDGITTETNVVGSKLTLTDNTITMEAYIDPDGPSNTSRGLVAVDSGSVLIEANADIVGGVAGTALLITDSGLQFNTNDGVTNQTFSIAGENLTFPGGPTLRSQNQTICTAGADTIIYTSYNSTSAIRLFVMVEGIVDGGGPEWEMQGCDVIAVKGYNDNLVHVTAYGLTYSSVSSFATFDGQWNATTSKMEITCRPTSATNNVYVNVHAVEFNSNN